jgi:hypothetical protein
MTCHLTFTKISSRSALSGQDAPTGPHAEYAGANIIQLPERPLRSSQTGAASVASLSSSTRPDHRELAALLFLFVVFGLPLIFFGSLYLLFVP